MNPPDQIRLRAYIENWRLERPLTMAGLTFTVIEVLCVELHSSGQIGRGEAAGVYYRGETAEVMLRQVMAVRHALSLGINRKALRSLMPAGGARSAIDCALWDLEAKLTGRPAWKAAGLKRISPVLTTITFGAESPEKTSKSVRSWGQLPAVKLKLIGNSADADRVRAIRDTLPAAWLSVDANQSYTPRLLDRIMQVLQDSNVKLIEQPFPAGEESLLDGYDSPIPIAADESVQTCGDLEGLVGRFQFVNIKLDKSGGLTEALAMARLARTYGLSVMVGMMLGTSLGVAPALLVAQLADVADLDGPTFLQTDRAERASYQGGYVTCPERLWGSPHS